MSATPETRPPVTRATPARTPSEGSLVAPPRLVQQHWQESGMGREDFWQAASPASNPAHELETLRAAWQELAPIMAHRPLVELSEVFEMPPAMTVRVQARVRHVGPAPFVFVDELADETVKQDE